jgi:hypothetical protein
MKKTESCSDTFQEEIINKEVFDREMALCKMLCKENKGKCSWGECDKCGVVPLLIKLHQGKVMEDHEEINQSKKLILG